MPGLLVHCWGFFQNILGVRFIGAAGQLKRGGGLSWGVSIYDVLDVLRVGCKLFIFVSYL